MMPLHDLNESMPSSETSTAIEKIDNEVEFSTWLRDVYISPKTKRTLEQTVRRDYIGCLRRAVNNFPNALSAFPSIFAISNINDFEQVLSKIESDEEYQNYKKPKGSGALPASLECYRLFLSGEQNADTNANFLRNINIEDKMNKIDKFSRNLIYFGAPGTGKSYTLNEDKKELLGEGEDNNYERVTFHPDYSYAHFVGTYKPVPDGDRITYSYEPGPFMRTYVKALKNPDKTILLVIEEINRANVAAVFGDVFQLLDRDDTGKSVYPIHASEDIKKYLSRNDVLGGKPEDYLTLSIPANMYIWATMNSADQGVFPMDTAFKRRWDFIYRGINEGDDKDVFKNTVTLGKNDEQRTIVWNDLRKAINRQLLEFNVNEDKLMGPYFIRPDISKKDFIKVFKNKVIMYLFDDAAKLRRGELFSGCGDNSRKQYSEICREFDQKGVYIFCKDIIGNLFKSTEG